jgi:hypothetical protein
VLTVDLKIWSLNDAFTLVGIANDIHLSGSGVGMDTRHLRTRAEIPLSRQPCSQGWTRAHGSVQCPENEGLSIVNDSISLGLRTTPKR